MATKILSRSAQVRMNLTAFWAQQKPGKIISIRMLFEFGPEPVVYLIMSEFVKIGKLVRPAWGVYMLPDGDGSMPTVTAVAEAKAEGFGKKIIPLNKEIQNSLRLKSESEQRTIAFASSGCSTRFRFGGRVIHFFKVADRKFELLKSKVGGAFATLWKTQSDTKTEIKRVFKELSISKAELLAGEKCLHLLPMWLKHLLRIYYPEFFGPQ